MAEKTQEEQKKGQNKEEQQSDDNKNAINFALIGSVVGASVGLAASPEVGKRVMQSGVVRSVGRELGRTAQDMIMEQAMITLRQNASHFSKYAGGMFGQKNESKGKAIESGKTNFEEQYKELKEENHSLNKNLQRIEEKLNALLEASNSK